MPKFFFITFKLLGEFMRKFIAVVLFAFIVAPNARAELTWNGGASIRHMIRVNDDGLDTRNAAGKNSSRSVNKLWQFRGGLGVVSRTDGGAEYGFDVRTANGTTTTPINSEWVTVQNGGDFVPTIGQAYARLKFKPFDSDLGVTVGRSKTALLYDNVGQALFDNDTRWDGFGWQWKMGMFGFNAVQYVLGATDRGTGANPSTYTTTESSQETGDTKSHFAVLYAFQPHATFQITEDITTTFAVGHLLWSGTGATATTGWYTNTIHGGTAGTVGNVNGLPMDNIRQWQFLSDTSLPFKLRFVAEYIKNKKMFYGLRNQAATGAATPKEADNDALALSLAYGKPKKAGEFGLVYTFSDKGLGAVITSISNGDVGADNRSHMFEGRYMLADSFSVSAKAQWHKEKARLGGDGQPLAAPNGNRNQTQARYEFIGAVSL